MKPIDCIEHIALDGERWDAIAWRYYGNPYDYGRIIEANPALEIGAFVPAGAVVLVPIKPLATVLDGQQLAGDDLPPWKR